MLKYSGASINFYVIPPPVHELQASIQVASFSPRSNFTMCSLVLALSFELQGFGGNDVGSGFRG